jgi:hypothetical protein
VVSNSKSRGFRKLALAGGMVLLTARTGRAQSVWQGTTGSWFTSGNWNGGVPNSTIFSQINNGGTAQIASGGAAASTLILGAGAGDSGTLSISGTGTLTTTTEYVGEFGSGTVNQSGGTNNVGTLNMATGDFHAIGAYTLSGGVLNVGTMIVGYSSNTAGFVQTGGTLSVTGSMTIAEGNMSIANVSDSVPSIYNEKLLALAGADGGQSAGDLTVAGNFNTNGVLDIGLGGAAAGSQYAVLDITGTPSLGGELEISLSNGFAPYPGETFNIIDCSAHPGTFSSVVYPNDLGHPFTVSYTSSGVNVTFVPEPGSLTLMAMGSLALMRRKRRA